MKHSMTHLVSGQVAKVEWEVGPFLIAKHKHGLCDCSYCQSGETGLVLPECRCWNAWRSVRWNWGDNYWVVRWTMPRWWPCCSGCAPRKKQKLENNPTGNDVE